MAAPKLSPVDAIMAEAADLVALEQIAALNTAHLPDDLESRFRKLKSLPNPTPNPTSSTTPPHLPAATLARSHTAPPPAAREPALREESPSPPRQACCFGFSPRRVLRRARSRGAGEGDLEVLGVVGEWGEESRRMARELREQRRKLDKALREQEKVSRESAKMAQRVRQASARMAQAAAIDDLLTDPDDDEELK